MKTGFIARRILQISALSDDCECLHMGLKERYFGEMNQNEARMKQNQDGRCRLCGDPEK